MLNYEEELKKFQPSLEVEDIEEAVYRPDGYAGHYPRSSRADEVVMSHDTDRK